MPAETPSDSAPGNSEQPHAKSPQRGSPGVFSDASKDGPSQPGHVGPPGIHAPWRLAYLEALGKSEQASGGKPSTGSFLADDWLDPSSDERNHVIVRTRVGLILLNAFPYAAGHVLVALGEPRATLLDYSPAQRETLWRHVDCAAALVHRAFEPQGINIGVNEGRAAGAGVPSHLHVHLVPRWSGDVNFISVVGQVRVIPSALDVTAQRYRAAWREIAHQWAGVLA